MTAPEEFFDLGTHLFSVCRLHGLFLRAGEDYTIDGGEILLGSDCAPELINVRRITTLSGTVLALELGHHGVIDHETQIRMTPSVRSSLHRLLEDLNGPDHS